MLTDDTALKARRVDFHELSGPPNCIASVSTSDVGSALQSDAVVDAIKNADKSLVSERVQLERLLRKHISVSASFTDLGRKSMMYHRIDIGYSDPVRQPMRRVPHVHISVL